MNISTNIPAILLVSLFALGKPSLSKADWVDVSSAVKITQSKQSLGPNNQPLFSYITIKNTSKLSIQGPLRLKVIDPAVVANNSQAYFDLSDGLETGESKTLKIILNLAKKQLNFSLALEKYRTGRVSAAYEYTCAIDDNDVQCFGRNENGQLDVPSDLSNPYQVSSGLDHVCALDETGVLCWGNNDAGQTSVPDDLKNPIQVTAGSYFSCAIDDTGLRCWGNSDYTDTIPADLKNPKQISAAFGNTCVIDDIGLHCWGESFKSSSLTFDHLQNPKQVSLAYELCAIDDNGLHCWELWGNKTSITEDEMIALQNPKYVSVGWGMTCVIDDNGVHCWHGFGKIKSVLDNLSNPVEVSAGDGQGCAFDDKGLHCWGLQYKGQQQYLVQ